MHLNPENLHERTCACGCGEKFPVKRHDHRFKNADHRMHHNNMRMLRGMKIYDVAMEWRRKRTKGSFTKMCAVIDDMIADDRYATRGPG